jgi:hypothetical protein
LTTTADPIAAADLEPLLNEIRQWAHAREDLLAAMPTAPLQFWRQSDDAGIELLRRLANAVPGFLPDPVEPCSWCSSYLRWHPGIGRWQGTLERRDSATWTDRCPIAPDHVHHPAPTTGV